MKQAPTFAWHWRDRGEWACVPILKQLSLYWKSEFYVGHLGWWHLIGSRHMVFGVPRVPQSLHD